MVRHPAVCHAQHASHRLQLLQLGVPLNGSLQASPSSSNLSKLLQTQPQSPDGLSTFVSPPACPAAPPQLLATHQSLALSSLLAFLAGCRIADAAAAAGDAGQDGGSLKQGVGTAGRSAGAGG